MQVSGPRPIASASVRASRPTRASTGFSATTSSEETRATGDLASLSGAMPLDALMTLQTIEDSRDAPARAAARGHDVLDALDALKLEMLAGQPDKAAVRRLQAQAARARIGVQDAQLSELLTHIDVRAAVELAKRGL